MLDERGMKIVKNIIKSKNTKNTTEKAKVLKKKLKTKLDALKAIESTLKKSLSALTKDINGILKEADVWYCSDDYIKDHEELRKPNDRNGDQIIIDYCTWIINGGQMSIDDEEKLWTKEEIGQKN